MIKQTGEEKVEPKIRRVYERRYDFNFTTRNTQHPIANEERNSDTWPLPTPSYPRNNEDRLFR